MKFIGGYKLNIAGKPDIKIRTIYIQDKLSIDLLQKDIAYKPIKQAGDKVSLGEAIAEYQTGDMRLTLPSPASGTVEERDKNILTLSVLTDKETKYSITTVKEFTREKIVSDLLTGGIWQQIWSSSQNSFPLKEEIPKTVIVNTVLSEPFKPTYRAILSAYGSSCFISGLSYLQQLMAEYSPMHFILRQEDADLEEQAKKTIGDRVWFRTYFIKNFLYPVEQPSLLYYALQRSSKGESQEPIWVLDAQTICHIGECIEFGKPLCERLIAVGGPACQEPCYLKARVGSQIASLIPNSNDKSVRTIKGGVMTGKRITPQNSFVSLDTDSIFQLKEGNQRELWEFIKPGWNKQSYTSCYLSKIRKTFEERFTTLLRGEKRACISCGLCDKVCPVGITPQLIHKYLFADELEIAIDLGIDKCVKCGLCSFVCPSKIELRAEIENALSKNSESCKAMG